MFLNERAQVLIEELRENEGRRYLLEKSSISDAMAILTEMHEVHASTDREKEKLFDTLFTLSNYNELLTELSKEK